MKNEKIQKRAEKLFKQFEKNIQTKSGKKKFQKLQTAAKQISAEETVRWTIPSINKSIVALDGISIGDRYRQGKVISQVEGFDENGRIFLVEESDLWKKLGMNGPMRTITTRDFLIHMQRLWPVQNVPQKTAKILQMPPVDPVVLSYELDVKFTNEKGKQSLVGTGGHYPFCKPLSKLLGAAKQTAKKKVAGMQRRGYFDDAVIAHATVKPCMFNAKPLTFSWRLQ